MGLPEVTGIRNCDPIIPSFSWQQSYHASLGSIRTLISDHKSTVHCASGTFV